MFNVIFQIYMDEQLPMTVSPERFNRGEKIHPECVASSHRPGSQAK